MKHLRLLPVLTVIIALLITSCRKEVSLEQGFTSVYTLQDSFGLCLGNTVTGNFVAGRAVNGDSNYLDLQVHVYNPGRYSVNTDIQNGFSFSGTGSFSDTGLVTIRIPARGTPAAEGITTLHILQDSGFCEVNVNVVAAVNNGGGTCNATASGTYKKDTAIAASNKITLSHNFSLGGTYQVTTDTLNGYYFNKSIVVATPGVQTIVLDGFGTPAALGTNNFTVNFGDGTTCGFSITVVDGTTVGGCGTANGTYSAGTALSASNTVTAQHVYATTGTFTASTNTVNGISFTTTPQTITGSGTATALTLSGTGTPTAAGTFSFSLNFGDGQTCLFNITIQPAGGTNNQELIPLTVGNTWSYTDADSTVATDTILARVYGTQVFNGLTYFAISRTAANTNTPDDTIYIRKDGGGIYYEYVDLDQRFGGSTSITFNGAKGDIPLYDPTVAQGGSFFSGVFNGVDQATGTAVQVRFKQTIQITNDVFSYNNHTLTPVIDVFLDMQTNTGSGGAFVDDPFFGSYVMMYMRGIGIVNYDYDGASFPLRYWNIQ